jgi:hypothetical protein
VCAGASQGSTLPTAPDGCKRQPATNLGKSHVTYQ